MGASTIEQQIKNFVLTECKMDKVGIAGIERFNGSPKGMHPTDFLPGCQSVIAFCRRLPDGAINAAVRAYEDKKYNVHGQYGAFGYVGAPNYSLLYANYKLARFVEKLTGEICVPESAGPTHGGKMMSMRHCAVAAGLGEFGWSTIVLTPEFGPRNRFGAVLTTAKLKQDPMYDGPVLCDFEHCHVCVDMCPTGAIPKYVPGQERVVNFGEGRVQRYSGINWTKCKVMCEGEYSDFNYNGDYNMMDPILRNPLDEDFMPTQGYRKTHTFMHFPQHGTSWKCGNCLQYCPVGNWKERFYDNKVSNVDINQFINGKLPIDVEEEWEDK